MERYLLLATIASVLLFAVYYFFLRKEAFHKFNRFYLLGALLLSLAVPLVRFSIPTLTQLFQKSPLGDLGATAKQLNIGEIIYYIQLPEFTVSAGNSGIAFFSATNMFLTLYLIGVAVFAVLFFIKIGKIIAIVRSNKKTKEGNVTFVEYQENSSAFSFFNYIFINNNAYNDDDRETILYHEKIHIKQQHSLDLILVELVGIFLWFNPVMWLYKRSLQTIHEYLADQRVVAQGMDKVHYLNLLHRQLSLQSEWVLGHHFNYLLTKNRFLMVLKNHYSRWAFAKVLLALPLIVFLLMLNCKPKPQEIPVSEDTQTQTTEVTETVADEAIETDNSKKEVVLQLTDAGKKQQAEDEKIIREKREKLLDANCWDHKKFRADLLKAFPQLLDKDGKINLSVTHDKANSCVIYSQKNYKRILEITRDECLVFHFKELNGYKMPEDLRKVVQENHNVVPIVTIAEGTIFTWADDKPDNDPPIRFAEVMPEPIGGMDAMYKFLQENLVYPANAKENNVGGRVFIEFVVGKDGTISNAKIIAGAEPKGIKKPYDQVVKDGIEALNAEALRVINLLPKWKPGTQMGKPVKCFYQIPIQFTIQ